jgi:hypothetical protein
MPNPWDNDPIVGAPPLPSAVPLPPSPQQRKQDARQAASDTREQQRLLMEQRRFEQQRLEWNATHNLDGSPKSADGALTQDAIVFNAQQYLATGQMPTLGMGKQAAADREAILNMAATIAGGRGLKGEDLARQIAHYKAGSRQLATLEQQLGTIRAAEQTALANGQQFIDRSAELPAQTSFSPINAVTQTVQRYGGGTTIAAADAAWNTFASEYAKVVAGSPSGAGTLSDSARHEAQETMRSNASPNQKRAAFEQMKRDMENRIAAIHGSINEGYKNLTEKPGYQIPDSTAGLSVSSQQKQQDKKAAVISGLNNPYGPTPGTPGGPQFNPLLDGGGNGPAPGLADGGANSKSLPIPQEMQAAHAQYLAQHWGHIDPNDYANFRAKLDQQYGFAPRMDAYKAIVPDLNARAASGGLPGGLNIPPVDVKANGLDRFNATVFNNPVGAAALGFGSLGGGADELAGATKSLFTGRPMSEEIARANAIRQAASGEYPVSSLVGNVGGTLALAGLTGGGSLAAAAGEAPILTGIGYGAANGLLENNDNRIGGAIGGAALGGVGGAVGKYIAAPVAKAVMDTKAGQTASKAVRYGYNRMFGNRLLPAIDAAPMVPEFQMGEKALPGSETLANARTNLTDASNLGLPYALADADPKLRMLAGSVARKSPNARDLAEQTFDPRALGQADRAVQAIDTHLAPITNIEQRGANLLAAGDQAAGPHYNLAFDRPGPVDPQIAAMLDTPAGRASLAHARTIAANRGLDPNKVGFDLNDQGEVVLKSVPSFETLQLVKRGMDAHLNSFADQFGNLNLRGNPLAQSVLDLKSRFNTKLGELNPNYAEGNRIWSGFAQRKDALDQGYKVLPNNAVPQRQFDASLAGMTPETLPEAQMGFATNMADTANRARLSADPYNSIYGSPLQQRKVAALFPEGAPTFGKIYDFERDMAKTRGETLGGSPTASRLAADQIFESPGGQALDAAIQLKTGGGVSLAQAAKIGSKVAQNYKLGLGVKKADALAPILFNTDTQSALNYLDDLALRKVQDEVRSRAFQRRYGMFGALGAPSIQQP